MSRAFVSITGATALITLMSTGAFAAKSAQDFIKDAIQGDNSEIMLGQLAEQKGGTQGIRDFGKTLVDDHTEAKQQASAVAKTIGVTPPDQPMQEAKDEQSKLSNMSGDAFDREFANYMVKDHQKDIQEFQDQAKANDGQTSALASKQLPVLEKHLHMAQALQGNAAQNGNGNQTAGATATALSQAPTQENPDEWRASKLPGVAIYGPDNKKVGGITDVLMSKDGKAEFVVIGVGGFLGIGQKDVAIPFDQVAFTDQPVASQAGSAAGNGGMAGNGAAADGTGATGATTTDTTTAGTTATGMGTGAGLAPATTVGLGTPANMAGANAPATAGAAAPGANGGNRHTAYPDHGTIAMTADQLKNAPSFHFAP